MGHCYSLASNRRLFGASEGDRTLVDLDDLTNVEPHGKAVAVDENHEVRRRRGHAPALTFKRVPRRDEQNEIADVWGSHVSATYHARGREASAARSLATPDHLRRETGERRALAGGQRNGERARGRSEPGLNLECEATDQGLDGRDRLVGGETGEGEHIEGLGHVGFDGLPGQ